MNCSRLPDSPPSIHCGALRVRKPPLGFESLNGHRKLATCLKCGPAAGVGGGRESVGVS